MENRYCGKRKTTASYIVQATKYQNTRLSAINKLVYQLIIFLKIKSTLIILTELTLKNIIIIKINLGAKTHTK